MIGIVLAGGRSTRMKQDKATMPHPIYSKQSLLDYALEQLLKAGCHKVIISGDKFGGVADRYQNKGPLGGIYSVTEKLCSQQCLIIPVDMPLLDHELLKELVNYSKHYPNVHFKEAPFPMVVHFDESAKRYLNDILSNEQSDRSITAFLQFLHARSVNCSMPEKLTNTNSPEDWASIKRPC
jgi:molybdopterin-guanine dinucleotide biosynthesis protein A